MEICAKDKFHFKKEIPLLFNGKREFKWELKVRIVYKWDLIPKKVPWVPTARGKNS